MPAKCSLRKMHLEVGRKGNCEEELPKKPVGRLSVNCRPTVGRLSVNCRPTVGRLSADSRPTVGRLSADSWPTDGRQVLPEI